MFGMGRDHVGVINITFYEFTETRVAHQRQNYIYQRFCLSFSFYWVSVDVLSSAKKFARQ